MKKLYTTIFLLTICIGLFSQGITIRFSGQLNGSEYCQLDRVVATNLTRNWTDTIEYPDTTLMLVSSTSFSATYVENQGLLQNVPNPFYGETSIEVPVLHSENVSMQLLDVTGKVYALYDGKLNEGTHTFVVTAAKPQTYILNALIGDKHYSLKMVNVGYGSANDIKYSGFLGNITTKLTSNNDFHAGDNMRYVGYATIDGMVMASVTVVQQQVESQDLTLNFYYPSQGTLNGHEWVNLGLPSGTCWATCNVGASSQESYGNYYAWGEVSPKAIYDWNYYRYCNGSANTLTKYCNSPTYGSNGFTDNLTVLEACDDVATANWGEGWRMPTSTEMQELFENCTRTWTAYGLLFVGPNGNSILLPVAGHRYEFELYQVDTNGGYWTSSVGEYAPYAIFGSFSSNGLYIYDAYRSWGFSVRAVCNPQE
jgi:hypothetical protein